jgi:hypothetical protein
VVGHDRETSQGFSTLVRQHCPHGRVARDFDLAEAATNRGTPSPRFWRGAGWPGLLTLPRPLQIGCPVLAILARAGTILPTPGDFDFCPVDPAAHAVIRSGQIVESPDFPGHEKSHDIGNTVPALARNARTGHPQSRNGKGKTKPERPGHPSHPSS